VWCGTKILHVLVVEISRECTRNVLVAQLTVSLTKCINRCVGVCRCCTITTSWSKS